ncbi:MAG TPA: hypothetical protein VGB07_05275 [Blastocatellia bacterium]
MPRTVASSETVTDCIALLPLNAARILVVFDFDRLFIKPSPGLSWDLIGTRASASGIPSIEALADARVSHCFHLGKREMWLKAVTAGKDFSRSRQKSRSELNQLASSLRLV